MNLILYSLLIAGVSFTFCVTSIFAPLREMLGRIHPKVDELVHCPWCFAHYLAFALVGATPAVVGPWTPWWLFNYLFTCFTVVAGAGCVHWVLLRAYEPVAKAEVFRKQRKEQSHE